MQNKVAVAKRDELRLGEVERERRERGKRGRDREGFKGFKCSFFNFNFYTPPKFPPLLHPPKLATGLILRILSFVFLPPAWKLLLFLMLNYG